MLTRDQSEKVAIAQKLLNEVKSEIADDFYIAVLLSITSSVCDQALKEDLPPQDEAWYSPQKIGDSLSVPSTSDRILKVLGMIAKTSLLSSALCGCLSLGAWGLSEFKGSTGMKISTDFAAETRSYRGLCFVFLSSTLICSALGLVVQRSED